MNKPLIAASILSADAARLGEESLAVIQAGADMIHFDVMDNHYVPNLTFGPIVCKALRHYGVTAPIDVHIMAKPVDSLIVEFAKAGANIISIHPESTEHLDRSLQLIREHGCQSGLALNPATPLSYLDHILDKIDMILLMSVNPGFGGQPFIPGTLRKVTEVRDTLNHYRLANIRLEVDGGINQHNIASIQKAGADTFVTGSAIFSAPNYADIIQKMKSTLTH